MMNETFYTNGKNKFKNDEFDGNEWSAPYMVDVNEIKDRINSFNLVGRKIKNIRFIGLCYNLRREWIEEIAYNNAKYMRFRQKRNLGKLPVYILLYT